MKLIAIDAALERVFKRQPYANHWGQKRLGFSGAFFEQLADGCTQMHTALTAFFALLCASLAILPLYLPHGSSLDVVLVSSTLAFCASVFFLRCLAWGLVSKPVNLNQIEDMQAWMLDYPVLTEAAAHWVRPGETLRQRDYTLLKWAHACIIADKKNKAVEASMAAGNHPLLHWTQRSLDVIKNHGANATWVLPTDLSDKQRGKLVALGHKLDQANYPEKITLTQAQGNAVSELHYSKYLEGRNMQDLFTYPALTGFGTSFGPLFLLFCGNGILVFFLTKLAFNYLVALEAYQFMSNLAGALLASASIVIPSSILAKQMKLAMGNAPLSPLGCHKLGELSKEHPLAANLFFSKIPNGRYLTYDHFQLFWKVVMVVRSYERSKRDEHASMALAQALENLPATKVSMAREEVRIMNDLTPPAQASNASRRI